MREQIGRAIEAAVGAQMVRTSYESGGEKSGLMRVMETEDYQAEIRYLRFPDTDNPMENPWHVKITGPDPLRDGKEGDVWSGSYSYEDKAVGAASGKLKKHQRRHGNRPDGKVSARTNARSLADAEEVASQLREVEGVSVDRVEDRSQQHESRDFIDLTFTRAPSASKAFDILTDNRFRPVALSGTWDEGRVVIQWKRP